MVRVVLDANVVISSALIREGNPASIFKMLALGEIKNSTTPEIIEEIKEVLARPRIMKRMSLVESEFILRSYEELSEKINPGLSFDEVKEDPDDNKILECAVAAAADYIIPGDNHLLKLGEFRGIKIVTPAEFIKIRNTQKGTAHHRSKTGGMLASLGAVPFGCKKGYSSLLHKRTLSFLCQCFPPQPEACEVVRHRSETGWKALCILRGPNV